MLSDKEEAFLKYWEASRGRQKKWMYQLLVGLPVGLLLCAVIAWNFYSGWFVRASMERESQFTLSPVIVIAFIIIAVFVAVFSKKFQWDQQQQKYLELISKKEKQAKLQEQKLPKDNNQTNNSEQTKNL